MADDKPKITRRRALGGLATIGAAGALGASTWATFSDIEDEIEAEFKAGVIKGTVDFEASYNGEQLGETNSDIATLVGNGEGVELALNDVKPGDYGSMTFNISLTGNDAWVASCLGYSAGEGTNVDHEGEGNDENEGDLQENLLIIPFYSPSEENNFFDLQGGNPDDGFEFPDDYVGSGTSQAYWNSREGQDNFDDVQPMTVGDAAEVENALGTVQWSDSDGSGGSSIEKTAAPEKSSAEKGCLLLDGTIGQETNDDGQGVDPMIGGSSLNFGYDWHLPYDTGNEAQGDTLTLKFSHVFQQTRHSNGPAIKSPEYAPEGTDADVDSTTTTN